MTRDLTRGSPMKLIIRFTIPLLIGNVFQQLYNMADTIIVGRTIGVGALAAVGATGSIIFLILGFAQGLCAGLSVITAQRFGAQDEAGVRRSVAVGIIISGAVTVLLTAVSVATAYPILEAMKTPGDIIVDAYSYIVVIYWGIAASMLFNFLSNVIRALGDSSTPLWFLIIACVINIGLDFLFISGFSMGVAGAAWATVIAQVISGVLCVAYIKKKLPMLRLSRGDWSIDRRFLGMHLRVALPMAFQASIIAIGAIAVQSALNTLGKLAVAAFTAAQKIEQLMVQMLMSFGVTMGTFSAQNYGAGDIARIRAGVRRCIITVVIFSVAGGAAIMAFGSPITRLFVGAGQEDVVRLAQLYCNVTCPFYFVLAILFVLRYTLQGLGKSLIPTIAGAMELIMRTAAAMLLAGSLGFTGVSIADPVAWIGASVPLVIAYFAVMRRFVRLSPSPSPDALALKSCESQAR